MPHLFIVLIAALLVLAIVKQVMNRMARYRTAAACAFGGGAIAWACSLLMIHLAGRPLSPIVAVLFLPLAWCMAVSLASIEVYSALTYLDKAADLKSAKPRVK